MNKIVFQSKDPECKSVALAGGKGAGLAKLAEGGRRVPAFVVVSKAACERFHAGYPDLAKEVEGFDFSNPSRLSEQAAALREKLAKLSFDAKALGLDAALDAAGVEGKVSVRSSACFEDSAASAFAGAHDTFLNVPREKAAEKVLECWLSLWGERALSYRKERSVSLSDCSMAAVVQAMAPAECAGVAFSIDPVSGDLSKVLVDANWGLGASVVDGSCEVDRWTLSKADGKVLEAAVAEKGSFVCPESEGEQVLDAAPEKASAPCLNEDQLAELAALARSIEADSGWPADIEWAYSGGELFVLQSRPITSVAPRWTRDESAERFPNPISALAWDLVDEGFHRSLNHSFALMGLPAFEGKWFANKGGYIYGNQNAVALYADRNPIPQARSPEDLARIIPELRGRFGWVMELPGQWHMGLDRYLLALGALASRDLSKMGLRESWRHLLDVRDCASEYFLPNIAISLAQRGLCKTLGALLGMIMGPEKAPAAFDALLASAETKTGQVNAALRKLAGLYSEARGYFEGKASREVVSEPRAGAPKEALAFYGALDELLRLHGHRENEFDPYAPTWGDAPESVVDLAAALSREGRFDEEDGRKAKMRAAAVEREIAGKLPEALSFFFSEVLRLARAYTSLDDLEHYQTTRISPVLRAAVGNLGAKLAEIGVLSDPLDAFFASFEVLRSAVEAPEAGKWAALAENIRGNKADWSEAKRREPEWVLGAADAEAELVEGAFKGVPGSPGQASGPAFLVRGPEDFARFPKGAVLVARTTNPAWTPLFALASAVVAASGGPLSHGAVTARELGKPAVMGLRGALDLFSDGQELTVDGSKGTVRPASAEKEAGR